MREVLGAKCILPWPEEQTLHMVHMVHTRLEENNWELQMDLVSAKISTRKDNDRKQNALKP